MVQTDIVIEVDEEKQQRNNTHHQCQHQPPESTLFLPAYQQEIKIAPWNGEHAQAQARIERQTRSLSWRWNNGLKIDT